MPHLLQKIAGDRKLLFYFGSEPIFLRVIISQDEAKRSPETADLLGPIAFETQKRLIDELREIHPKIEESWFENPKKPLTEDKKEKWRNILFPNLFSQGNNYTAISLEDESGRPMCATAFTINDKEIKEIFRLKERAEYPVIFFDLSQTLPEFSGKGLLKIMRSLVIPSLLHDAEYENGYYANSMKVMTAINPKNGEAIHSCPNFVIHNNIFKFCGDDVSVLPRYKNVDREFSSADEEFMPSTSFYEGEKFDKDKLVKSIVDCRKKCLESADVKLEGFFMATMIKDLKSLILKAQQELLQEKDGKIECRRKLEGVGVRRPESRPLRELTGPELS